MIGQTLDRYTILEVVGSGSMGTVYKAEDPAGRTVALKFVPSRVLYSIEKRERFLQCLLAASEIRHPGICPILDIGDCNDDFFVIFPFVRAKTLAQLIDKKPLSWPCALDIARALGSALQAIHDAGTTHRALKPGNIWITDENSRAVLVADCGIARFTEIGSRGRSRAFGPGIDFADTLIPLDSLAYMSPEQVRGETVDSRSDIFSFGVVLYEMLRGRHPFEAGNSLSMISAILDLEPTSLGDRQPALAPLLDPILRRALAKNPDDRYPRVQEMLAEIECVRQAPTAGSRQNHAPAGFRKFLFPHFWQSRR